MYKYAIGTQFTIYLTKIINALINKNVKPKNWNRGEVITIVKDSKGDLESVDNSRPITISDSFAIVWENIILELFEEKAELQEQQFGFRKFSSMTQAIFALRETLRVRKIDIKKAYVLFVDFSKAFDKVHKKKMLVKLSKHFNKKVWLGICNYYRIATIKIHDSNGKTVEMETKSGVKQGGPFSPSAYDDYVDDCIIEIIDSAAVITHEGIITGIIIYADDTTIACETPELLKKVFEILINYCKKFDITTNEKKQSG